MTGDVSKTGGVLVLSAAADVVSQVSGAISPVKGPLTGHLNESPSEGHREFEDLEWIARLTSHIPEGEWRCRNARGT